MKINLILAPVLGGTAFGGVIIATYAAAINPAESALAALVSAAAIVAIVAISKAEEAEEEE